MTLKRKTHNIKRKLSLIQTYSIPVTKITGCSIKYLFESIQNVTADMIHNGWKTSKNLKLILLVRRTCERMTIFIRGKREKNLGYDALGHVGWHVSAMQMTPQKTCIYRTFYARLYIMYYAIGLRNPPRYYILQSFLFLQNINEIIDRRAAA